MDRVVEESFGRKTITYKENDLIHNSNGPAIYNYFTTGKVKSLAYYQNGIIFRPNDLPNYIQFYQSGSFFLKEWRDKENKLHRLTGPAKILYYDSDVLSPWEEHYIHGNYFPYWLPRIKFGNTKEKLSKQLVVQAIFFHMEYGLLLKKIYDNQKTK